MILLKGGKSTFNASSLINSTLSIFSFESSQEIVRVLKEQWSGLFQRLLSKEEDKPLWSIGCNI